MAHEAETLRSRPSRSHENRGAGQQHGVGLGVPTPRLETEAGAAAFRTAERVSEVMGSGRREEVHEQSGSDPRSGSRSDLAVDARQLEQQLLELDLVLIHRHGGLAGPELLER